MKLHHLCVVLVCLLSAMAARSADNSLEQFPGGASVVVAVSQFPPTVMSPLSSGYTKPLVIHPGKRGKVTGWEWNKGSPLIRVNWEEQHWQEWTEPSIEGYLDNNRWFMAQTGKWIKWKAFTSTIHPNNLVRIDSEPGR